MTKKDFLTELEASLKKIPKSKRDKIILKIDDEIKARKKSGELQKDILKSLGNPRKLGEKITEEYNTKKELRKKERETSVKKEEVTLKEKTPLKKETIPKVEKIDNHIKEVEKEPVNSKVKEDTKKEIKEEKKETIKIDITKEEKKVEKEDVKQIKKKHLKKKKNKVVEKDPYNQTFKDIINETSNKLVAFFKDYSTTMSSITGQTVLALVIKIIIVFVLIWLLKIPFLLVEKLGAFLLLYVPLVFGNILSDIWALSFEFLYLISSIIIFLLSIKHTMLIQEKKDKKKLLNENSEESSKEIAKSENAFYIIGEALCSFFRILLVFLAIPVALLLILLSISLGILVCYALDGVYLISLFIILLGLVILVSSIFSLIMHYVQKGWWK